VSAPGCRRCSGFGWFPLDRNGRPIGDWYRRDWRLCLEADREWRRCPDPIHPRRPGARLQECLAAALVSKLDEEAGPWYRDGSWMRGRLPDDRRVWAWKELRCLEPGPDDSAWVLASPMGVMRGLDHGDCAHHVRRAGGPRLP